MTDHLSREQVEALMRQAAEEIHERRNAPRLEGGQLRLVVDEMHDVVSSDELLWTMDEIVRRERK